MKDLKDILFDGRWKEFLFGFYDGKNVIDISDNRNKSEYFRVNRV